MGPGVWWLCRLVPGNYAVEEAPCGQMLYQIIDAEAVPAQQRRGTGQQVHNVVNRSRRVLGIAPIISAKPTTKPTPKPRLTRPAA